MKKIISLIAIFIAFSSCQEDIKFNDPGFQATKDGILFQGIDVKAYKNTAGALRIVAVGELEQIELKTSSSNVGPYYLGSIFANSANYRNTFDATVPLYYSSLNGSSPILSIANAILSSGQNYTAANSVSTTTNGSGSGMKVNTTVSETGGVNSVKISTSGFGYEIGDIITIAGGNNNAKFRILSEIKITDNSNNTVTGTFKLNVKRSGSEELVNFQYGDFKNIPVINEL